MNIIVCLDRPTSGMLPAQRPPGSGFSLTNELPTATPGSWLCFQQSPAAQHSAMDNVMSADGPTPRLLRSANGESGVKRRSSAVGSSGTGSRNKPNEAHPRASSSGWPRTTRPAIINHPALLLATERDWRLL